MPTCLVLYLTHIDALQHLEQMGIQTQAAPAPRRHDEAAALVAGAGRGAAQLPRRRLEPRQDFARRPPAAELHVAGPRFLLLLEQCVDLRWGGAG